MLNLPSATPLTEQELEELVGLLPKMHTLVDLQQLPEMKLTWWLEGLLPDGFLIVLTSKGKTGKTTFIIQLVKAMIRGEETFLGLRLERRKILLISEEDKRLYRSRFVDTRESDLLTIMAKPFLGRPDPGEWKLFCHRLARVARALGFQFVVIDPMANLIPGDENTSGGVLDFLSPLDALTEQGIGVLILHHPNKSGSDPFRGSSATRGKLDVGLEMKRPSGMPESRSRSIETTARHGIPCREEIIFELSEDEQSYRVLGDLAEAVTTGMTPRIRRFLGSLDNEGRTTEEIRAELPWPDGHRPSLHVLQNTMKKGLGKHWARQGKGTLDSPYRYHALRPASPGPVAETKGVGGGE
jgi:AAA domain-containing protein